jgi:hypothetical protein
VPSSPINTSVVTRLFKVSDLPPTHTAIVCPCTECTNDESVYAAVANVIVLFGHVLLVICAIPGVIEKK